MRMTSIFALLAAATTFADGGISITVNATVDSHIESVTVHSGSQTLGTIPKNGSVTWTAWNVDTAYTPTFAGVSDGYTAHWRVTASGVSELSGGVEDAITLSQPYAGCTLSFYGTPNTYSVTLDRQSGSGGTAFGGDVGFLREAGFTEVYMGIDAPRQQPRTWFLWRRLGFDGGYLVSLDGEVTKKHLTLGTDIYIFDYFHEARRYIERR